MFETCYNATVFQTRSSPLDTIRVAGFLKVHQKSVKGEERMKIVKDKGVEGKVIVCTGAAGVL